jgi:hypothetical protein
MSRLLAFSAIVLIFAFCLEWMQVKQTGWDRLAERYACSAPFAGKYRACWWAQFIFVRPRFKTVANVGRMTRWPIRLEFPPCWVSADSRGLYLKRNAWNFLHSPLLIPWDNIQSANEVSYTDLIRIGSAASALATATQAISGRLLQLKLSDPSLSIVAQLAAFEGAHRFLGGKLTLLNSQGVRPSTIDP